MNWLLLDCFNTLIDEADGLTHQSGMQPLAHIPVADGLFADEAQFLQAYLHWRGAAWRGHAYPEVVLRERLKTILPNGSDATVERMVSAFESNFLSTLTPTPGILEILPQLLSKYRIAVVSNFSHPGMSRELLQHFGLLNSVEFVLDSSEFGFKKPDKKIYHEALRLCGAEAHQVTFIGDSLRNDVQAPIENGMEALWFDRLGQGAPNGITAFRHWQELPLLATK
jgi:putative hydrolase of the HAD superfamily